MQILNSMYGQAVGDMLGEPLEGLTRKQIKAQWRTVTGFVRPPSITDDTVMTHLVVQSVCEAHKVDRRHIAGVFLMNRARIPRIGPTTAHALSCFADDPGFMPTSGTTDGAAMRAPAIAWLFPADRIIPAAIESSLATHGADVAIAGACAIACAVSSAIDGAGIEGIIQAGIEGAEHASNDLATRIRESVMLTSGKTLEEVIDTVGCGIETMEAVPATFAVIASEQDFRSGVLAAVNLGGDADTIASMVGAILGGMLPGRGAIPGEWIDACRRGSAGDVETLIRESWRCVSELTFRDLAKPQN
ncbi:MAG: ADP-ribosylglycohydrolase family protein [Methanosarcinales archaeon]|nr:ADP-ribosylglycohydrolase family protein [Methanosarcinales archaeon]